MPRPHFDDDKGSRFQRDLQKFQPPIRKVGWRDSISSVNMGYEVLLGESCFTVSEAQKLSVQINQKSDAQVQQISGQWLYYVDSENKGNSGVENTLERVKQLVQASNVASTGIPSKSSDESGKTLVIYIAPRNTPSPWSSKATSIAQVCGVKARIERGRVVTIEFDESFNGDTTSFRDILHDRMTESFTESLPQAATMFAEGARGELVVVDIFADERGPLAALQDYNKEQGLGLDIPNMEYLVEQYKALGRSPVRGYPFFRAGNMEFRLLTPIVAE